LLPHLWLSIAKNEIWLWSSHFRKHRALLFTIVGVFVVVYAFMLVPLILNAAAGAIYTVLTNVFGLALPFFMYFVFSIALLFVFMWCITYPLSSMLQGAQDLQGAQNRNKEIGSLGIN
jgi:uncharacterized membrane protein